MSGYPDGDSPSRLRRSPPDEPAAKRPRLESKDPQADAAKSGRKLTSDVIELDPARAMPHVSPLYGDISAADGYVRAVVTPDGNGVYAPYTTKNGGVLRRKVMVEFPVRTGTIAVYIETVHTPHASAPTPPPPRR